MIKIVTSLILLVLPSIVLGQGFFEERYRGWFWFENKPLTVEKKTSELNSEQNSDISPEQAKAEIEQFARELEDLKFMMLARPTPQNVKAYRDKEKQMWDQADSLHEAWDTANFLYPEQRDLINNPVNVHGVKAKRAMQEEQDMQKIKELAKDFDLVLFFSDSCKYCALLSPVLKNFGEIYGFHIDAVSNQGSKHEHFKTVTSQELIERLGITAFPTVIAVSHDSKTAFELIRG
ncbi:conjugal transfer protein TraF, partial [Candidatus Trichorickettsia mobilis]|uniref:conjugal transfer protein TraF n=1 Tax=Candidatus Trichorickettsia mobilis TaxID=1346319 RepID=UPI002B25871B